MKTVIMAGGKGTRISSIASDIPKPMIKIDGMPVLEREIYSLRDQGFKDIIITVGHLGNIIINYFGDGHKISPATGEEFGVDIEYYNEELPLGNAGALYEIKDKLTEDFLLINGDIIFDIDINRFLKFHKSKKTLATVLTHPNNHPYDSGLIISDQNNIIQDWLAKEDERPIYYKNRVNAGIHILSPLLLLNRPESEKVDLDRDILKPNVKKGVIACYDSPEYVRDMGTPERYNKVASDLRDGIIKSRNLKTRQKAFFIDRDGTINKHIGFLKKPEEIKLLDGASEAISRINDSGYLAIIITNQPVIARGDITVDELKTIHNALETQLGNEHAYIDAIYYCPHHPDSGFKGEVKELKIDCECRKPKAGLLFKAANDYNIDLTDSFMIGDSDIDIAAGVAAGCKTGLIIDKQKLESDLVSNFTGKSLLEIVEKCLRKEQ